MRGWALWCCLALAGCTSCSKKEVRNDGGSGVAASAPTASLFVSSDMRGYLGPCGCSENMRGGVPRAAFQIAEARKSGRPVLYVDAGDSLFGHKQIPEPARPQEERKARALAEAFKQMQLAARAVGELDDARGAEFRKGLGLPELAEGEFKVLDAKVGVVAGSTAEALKRASKNARAQGAVFVVGLVHQGVEQAQALATSADLGVDLLVVGHGPTEFSGEDNKLIRGQVPIAQVQSKGRSLLRVDLYGATAARGFELLKGQGDVERELNALDERIELLRKQVNEPSLSAEMLNLRKAKLEEVIARREALASAPPQSPPAGKNGFVVRFIPLESNFEGLPEVKAIVTAYDRDVGQLNLAWAKEHGKDCPAPAPAKAGFVGNESCRNCHEEAFAVWDASKHAHGYETLEQQGKNFHLDCVKCHVTGWEQPGGVCRVDKVENRKGVGCESCHGAGSLHAEEPTVENIAKGNQATNCVGCHDPENSPHFELASYLEKILGPGHGRPVVNP
jgi:hypothetical protein